MAKSQNSFIKKQKADRKRKKKEEKFQKKLQRKDQETSGNLDDMIAYVDEYGNIVDQPVEKADPDEEPSPEEQRAMMEAIGETVEEEVMKGVVKFFNEEKGFGFIRLKGSGKDVYVQRSGLLDQISDNDRVSLTLEEGVRGPVAVDVRKL